MITMQEKDSKDLMIEQLKLENQKLQEQFKNYINESNKEKLELVNRILELQGQATTSNDYNDMPDCSNNDEWMKEYSNAFYVKEDDANVEASNY